MIPPDIFLLAYCVNSLVVIYVFFHILKNFIGNQCYIFHGFIKLIGINDSTSKTLSAASGTECFLCRTFLYLPYLFKQAIPQGGAGIIDTAVSVMYFLAQKVPKTWGVPIPPTPPQTARDFRPWTHIGGPHAFLFWQCFSSSYFRSIIPVSTTRSGNHKHGVKRSSHAILGHTLWGTRVPKIAYPLGHTTTGHTARTPTNGPPTGGKYN